MALTRTTATTCVTCDEESIPLDARGICLTCAPSAVQCAECKSWHHKTGDITKGPGTCWQHHWICGDCQHKASRTKYVGDVICPVCAEEDE